MQYDVLNYTEQGGDVTHIGGKLVFDEGASVKGFPGAANLAPSEAATVAALKDDFNALIDAMKEAGVMVPDAWEISARMAPSLTDEVAAANNDKATVAVDGNDITITVDVASLEETTLGVLGQKAHKWLGLGIGTGLTSAILAEVNGRQLTEDDVTEAVAAGLDEAGEFILYVKAESAEKIPVSFTLDANKFAETDFTIQIEKPAAEGGDGE